MGLEVKLLIGSLHDFDKDDSARWLQVISMIELSDLGKQSLIHKFNTLDETYPRVYFYDINENLKIDEDHRGTELRAIPISEFLKVFRKECERSEETQKNMYRRLAWTLPLLTRMKNYQPIPNLHVVLFYH
jgi:hypothetical protein